MSAARFTGMTIGDKLREAQARRIHVTNIKDPMVRALAWKHVEWAQVELLVACRQTPSEFSHLMADAEGEIEYAREARRKILMHRWAMRPSIPFVPATLMDKSERNSSMEVAA